MGGGVKSLCSEVCAQHGLDEGQIGRRSPVGRRRRRSADRNSNRRLPRLRWNAFPFDRCSSRRCLCSPLVEAKSATEKKSKLCVSVCLPACPTDCLTDCLPD